MTTTTGYIADANFQCISADHYAYFSPAPERYGKRYDIRYINHRWTCNCPSARELHKIEARCKHERALCQLIDERIKQNAANRQAQEIAERAEEIESLRAEIAQLRAELAAIQSQPATAPDLAAILQEINALKQENEEIKKQLATKATKRRKHQSEQEVADAKRGINTMLDDVMIQAESAINAAKLAKAQIKDLEVIPHELKEQLDRLTEQGQPELQPDYEPEERNSDEVRSEIRAIQESTAKKQAEREARAKKLADQMQERHEQAPLNGNDGFQFFK